MSILIKGMEMPSKGCCNCPLKTGEFCGQLLENDCVREHIFRFTRPDNCPLVEIPSKHGDLIDRDELKAKIEKLKMKSENGYINVGLTMALGLLQKSAPTIIEAEG